MKTSNFDINVDYELILDTLMYKIRQIFARISLELSILINARGKEKIKYSMQLSANTCKYFIGTFTLPRSCTRKFDTMHFRIVRVNAARITDIF